MRLLDVLTDVDSNRARLSKSFNCPHCKRKVMMQYIRDLDDEIRELFYLGS